MKSIQLGRKLQRLRREALMLELNSKPKPEVAGKEEVKVDPKFEPKQELESVADEPMVDEPMWKEEECEEVAEEAVPPKQWQASSRVLMKLWKIKADLEFKKRQAGMLRYLVHEWHVEVFGSC
jgi:hypothetical protein